MECLTFFTSIKHKLYPGYMMKLISATTIFISLICLSVSIYADEPATDLEIFAKRGKGVVTQEDFTARADMIPEEARKGTLRDQKRVNDLLQSLLLTSQLVADAHEAGFDKEQVVINRMQLAADTELANAWLNHYVDSRSTADYEALAHENYLLNQESIMSQPKVDVSHILISTKERPDADAKALADTISCESSRTLRHLTNLSLSIPKIQVRHLTRANSAM